MQAVATRVNIIHLDIGKALCTESRNVSRIVVDLFARQTVATRQTQCRDAALGVAGWSGEYLEVDRIHEISDFDELEIDAQIGLVGAVIVHRVCVAHARKR